MKNPSLLCAFMLLLTASSSYAQELHRTGLLYEDVTKNPAFIQAQPRRVAVALPPIVDNSAHLPPVGDQSRQASCVAWAVGYYYKTYQEWQDYGWSVTSPDHIMSPAFIYNHINGGRDGGAYLSDGLKVLNDLGCATMADFPYDDSNCTRWPADSVYRHAMTFRTAAWFYVDMSQQSSIELIKQHLANGNLAILGIYIYSNFDNISSFNNTYCASQRYGNCRGGHAATIVGYDNNKITADGVGAFRLVNSWGTAWGDAGYYWMSYQAVMDQYLSQQAAYYTTDLHHYTPTLIATVNISHSNRNVLDLSFGVGSSIAPDYSKRFFNFGISSIGPPPQAFSAGDISFDLSEAAELVSRPGAQNAFMTAQSTVSGTVNSFSVTDLRCAHTDWSTETPKTIPNTNDTVTTNLVLLPVEPVVYSPAMDERVKAGADIDIVWTPARYGTVDLDYSTDNGAGWTEIASQVKNIDGTYRWTIPPTPSSTCKIRIRGNGSSGGSFISNNVFAIAPYGIITETDSYQRQQLAYNDTLDGELDVSDRTDEFSVSCAANDTLLIGGENRGNKLANVSLELFSLDAQAGYRLIAQSEFLGSLQKKFICVMPSHGDVKLVCSNKTAFPAEYRIRLQRFKKGRPELEYLQIANTDTLFFSLGFFPNASPTTVTIEYGPTDSYGMTLVAGTGINGIACYRMRTENLLGLTPGMFYHCRVRLENEYGVYLSEDHVIQRPLPSPGWTKIQSPATGSLYAVDFIDDKNGIVCGDSIVLKTVDGGQNWIDLSANGPGPLSASICDYATKDKIIISHSSGTYISDDAGKTWRSFQVSINNPLHSIAFYDSNVGFVGDFGIREGGIYKTNNGGLSWSQSCSNPQSGNRYPPNAISMLNLNTIVAEWFIPFDGGESNTFMYKSVDGGITWSNYAIGSGYYLSGMAFADNQHGMAVGTRFARNQFEGSQGVVFKTDDGGTTWYEYYQNRTGELLRSIAMSNINDALVLTDHGTIIRTTDGGATWTPQQTGTHQFIRALKSLPSGITWAVGDSGTILVHDARLFSWFATLNVRNNSDPAGINLSYGTASAATDGIDAPQGETPLPSPPFGFDARFQLPSGEDSWRDFRRDGQDSIEWIIKFQPGDAGYPMTFTWDNTSLPIAMFFLRDRVGGSVVNIDMKNQNHFVLSDPGITSLSIIYRRQLRLPLAFQNGWNIVSLPVALQNQTPASVFPDAASPVYDYTDRYNVVTSLQPGKGYWVKLPYAYTADFCGTCAPASTIPVTSGWNLIGGYERALNIAQLTTTPPDLFTSPFYGYTDSYNIPNALEPGKGYWIRSSGRGVINTQQAQGSTPSTQIVATNPPIDPKWLKITLRDHAGNEARVYSSESIANPDIYALPPAPPSGVFDLRWDTDRRVEQLHKRAHDLIIRSASYPLTLSVAGGDMHVCDKLGGRLINTVIKEGTSISIEDAGIDRLEVRTPGIPVAYELYQNYPNPFNPSTTIKFALPEKTAVKLTIFNSLGQRVDQLIDREMEAGYYSMEWNAKRFASGVYFYEINTPMYRNVKKLILLK